MSYDQAICPLCGRAAGKSAAVRVHSDDVPTQVGFPTKRRCKRTVYRFGVRNHWERMLEMWDPEKPFGCSQEGGRRGRMEVTYFEADDPRAEPFLPPMRELMLRSIRRFLKQGLITQEDLNEIKTRSSLHDEDREG